MNYTEKIVSHEFLKDDVLCYWQMKAAIDQEAGVNARCLPKGQNLLVFNYGGDTNYPDAPKIKFSNLKFFIVPAFATSKMINQKGGIDLFGISFIGDGLYKLTGQPIPKLINDFPNKLVPQYEALHTELRAMNFSGKVERAEKFLVKNLNQNLNSPPFQQAIKIIHAANGVVTVSDIASQVYVSERQLQRLFKARIGISPKAYCKIKRVNNYINYILSRENTVDWMELVVKYDYHDQPHLINEVKSITRLSPRKLQSYRDTLYHRYAQV